MENSGTGAGYSSLELYVLTVAALNGIRSNQQEIFNAKTAKNAKHSGRHLRKKKNGETMLSHGRKSSLSYFKNLKLAL